MTFKDRLTWAFLCTLPILWMMVFFNSYRSIHTQDRLNNLYAESAKERMRHFEEQEALRKELNALREEMGILNSLLPKSPSESPKTAPSPSASASLPPTP